MPRLTHVSERPVTRNNGGKVDADVGPFLRQGRGDRGDLLWRQGLAKAQPQEVGAAPFQPSHLHGGDEEFPEQFGHWVGAGVMLCVAAGCLLLGRSLRRSASKPPPRDASARIPSPWR